MRRMLIALAGATLLVAGACGDDDSSSDATREAFMSACTQSGAGTVDGDLEGYCRCTYDALGESMSAEEIAELAQSDPSTSEEMLRVATECAAETLELPEVPTP